MTDSGKESAWTISNGHGLLLLYHYCAHSGCAEEYLELQPPQIRILCHNIPCSSRTVTYSMSLSVCPRLHKQSESVYTKRICYNTSPLSLTSIELLYRHLCVIRAAMVLLRIPQSGHLNLRKDYKHMRWITTVGERMWLNLFGFVFPIGEWVS